MLILLLTISMIHAESVCTFTAFVNETDPAGLNVRTKPTKKSAILGTIPPLVKEKDGDMKVRPEVEVTAAHEGWFRVKKAKDNATLMEAVDRAPRPMFTGEGWVSGTKLTVKSQAFKARHRPSETSAEVKTGRTENEPFDGDADLDALYLLDCQKDWVQVQDRRLKKNNAFWINKICALQETSCSG